MNGVHLKALEKKFGPPIAYLEAVVRIPLFQGDDIGEDGPGKWWEYVNPQIDRGEIITVSRPVTEISRKLIREEVHEKA